MPATSTGANTAITALFSSTVYLGLLTSSNSEPSGGGYARVSITTSQRSISGGVVTISAAMDFSAATTGAWGTLTQLALYTAASGGTQNWRGNLTNSLTVASGDRVYFTANTLTFTISSS